MANTGVKDKPWKMQAKPIMVNFFLVTISMGVGEAYSYVKVIHTWIERYCERSSTIKEKLQRMAIRISLTNG